MKKRGETVFREPLDKCISALANLESAIVVSNSNNITYFFVFSKALANLGVVLLQGLANFVFCRPQMNPLFCD